MQLQVPHSNSSETAQLIKSRRQKDKWSRRRITV